MPAAAEFKQMWNFEKWEVYKNPSLHASVPFHPSPGRNPIETFRTCPGKEREGNILKWEEKGKDDMKVQNRFQASRHSQEEDLAHAYKVMAEGQDRDLMSASETARVQDGINYVDSVVEGRAELNAGLEGTPGRRNPVHTPDISISENIRADEDGPDHPRDNVFPEFAEIFSGIGEEEQEEAEEWFEDDLGDLDGDGVNEPDWIEREKLDRKEEEEEWEIY